MNFEKNQFIIQKWVKDDGWEKSKLSHILYVIVNCVSVMELFII